MDEGEESEMENPVEEWAVDEEADYMDAITDAGKKLQKDKALAENWIKECYDPRLKTVLRRYLKKHH